MEHVKLSIELDRAHPAWVGGEPIRGQVVVDVHHACQCDQLVVGLGITASSKGDAAVVARPRGAVLDDQVLFRGAWAQGQRLVYPFSLPSPLARTYRGVYMDTHLVLQAIARIPGKVKTEIPIEVSQYGDPGTHLRWDPAALAPTGQASFLAAAAACIAGAAGLAIGVHAGAEGLLAILAILLILGMVGVIMGVRPWWARRATGPVEIQLHPLDADGTAGIEALDLDIQTRADAPITKATAGLIVREYVRYRYSDASREWQQELFHRDVELVRADPLAPLRGRIHLPTPGQVPYNFAIGGGGSTGATRYAIEWELSIRLAIARRPDWIRRITLRARSSDRPFD